jgi:VIT1/CCC1 family predicted Fe2+/Mn2+ transporter
MDKETKRMSVGLLSIIGSLSIIFPIEFYFINPSGWHLALALHLSSWVIGAVLITLAIVIQKRKITEAKKTLSQNVPQ